MIEIRRLGEEDREAAHRVRGQAFGHERRQFDPDRPVDLEGDLHLGAYDGGRLVGVATARVTGQYFGGRAVPMGAVASVAVVPEARGGGVGGRLMRRTLAGMRAEGLAISTLYPSATTFYRRLGWEIGGLWSVRSVSTDLLADLPAPSAPQRVRPAEWRDPDVLETVYALAAPRHDGWLVRRRLDWRTRRHEWQREERGPHRFLYVCERDGEPVGYLAYRHREDDPRLYGLEVSELVADDRDAHLGLLRLLGTNRTMTGRVRLQAGEDLHLLLPDQDTTVEREWRWMTRLVDAPAAIRARGYPAAVTARLELAIADPEVPDHDGPHVLEVAEGTGRLTAGGSGGIRLGINALSSLFTGALGARELAALGALEGARDQDLAALDAVFAGPRPWCPDFF